MQLLVEVPKHGKLAYCLLRDDRVPRAPKAVLLAALAVIVSPLDLPAWIPLVGELDVLALAILAVETFIEACPEDVRREHQEALAAKDSTFDHDLHDTLSAAREGTSRIIGRIRARFRRQDSFPSVAEG